MDVCGIVLGGGRSSRMGQDKTLMKIGSESMMERTVSELRLVVDEIIIAGNSTEKYRIPGTREVMDVFPHMGPLGGIHAGLLATGKECAFVVAGDMPLFKADLAGYLLKRRQDHDVVVPIFNGRAEPLCGIYSRRCIAAIEECLLADKRKVITIYPKVKVLEIQEEELAIAGLGPDVFLNLNSPEDYRSFCNQEPFIRKVSNA